MHLFRKYFYTNNFNFVFLSAKFNDYRRNATDTTDKERSHPSLDDQSVSIPSFKETVSKLPLEMQKSKQSRLHIQNSLEEIKNSKKLEFYEQHNNEVEFKQCTAKNCKDCAK